ncbi:hypothetical protein [Sphingobacterium sp. UBA5996]|uniref:hypothetical protein n=1 Tax=Sphingobacterium sp. UBA5996 TaxID=1947505 RepID=UPI0025FFB780|nr:hypothetical protein [Sphingobacterium sp. UBA5996]
MNIADILKKVEVVNNSIEYWFVRTDYGKLFEQFLEGGYIAIGWDYVTVKELDALNEDIIKKRIAEKEEFDLETTAGKSNSTSVYNKLMTFKNLKKGDIVVMPSRNSDRLAFGTIEDDDAFTADAESFTKRRSVNWHEVKQIDDLNAIFYQVKSNQHTISSINRFAPHIDRVVGNLFEKNDFTHYVLKIEKDEDINFEDLNTLMSNIKSLTKEINKEFKLDEDMDEFFIKINLQSKGAVELIKSGKSLAILAFLLFCSSCGELHKQKDPEIKKFIENNGDKIENTTKVLDSLRANTDEMTKPFSKK